MAPDRKSKRLLVLLSNSENDVCGEFETHNLGNNSSSGGTTSEGDDSITSEIAASSSSGRKFDRNYRRSRSWCGDQRDDSSEVRIFRERLLRTQSFPQPTSIKSFTRKQKLTLISLALVDFLSFCSMSIMAPFFPKEATEKGISETMSGFVFSFYALVMFLSSPVFGKNLPWIGAKFMFISGIFIAGACNILFGTLEYMVDKGVFLVFCFVIRGLEALGASAYSTASYVFVVNTFPGNIGSVLGILETFVGLGMSIGPAIGALLYSLGGFGLPFYVLGILIIVVLPVNWYLLENDGDYVLSNRNGSILQLLKIPSVVITGLVIVVVSNTWAFLDPTLEPHLRQYGLSTGHIGLVFLMFSALYGIFSPIWGWLADRINSHWCMMVWGLFLSTAGLLMLGPTPIIPGLTGAVWLDLLALSILGISVALTLLPTFQGVLTSSIEEGGCPDALVTYSVVAGVWSCCYSLGEVIGPALGGFIAHNYGFPMCATLMASLCFVMGVVTLTFFVLHESSKVAADSVSISSSPPICRSEGTWNSGLTVPATTRTHNEETPLLSGTKGRYCALDPTSDSLFEKDFTRKKRKTLSISEIISHVLMFKFLTNIITRKRHKNIANDTKEKEIDCTRNGAVENKDLEIKSEEEWNRVSSHKNGAKLRTNEQCLDDCSQVYVKKNGSGVVAVIDMENTKKRSFADIVKYNLTKIKYFERRQKADYEKLWNQHDRISNIQSTITISNGGACEV